MRFSRLSRSASINSVSTVSASPIGIDAAFDMGDVVILETAQHMRHRVHFADIGQELVAQPFALGRAAHQPGNVDEGDAGGNDLGRTGDLGQRVQPRIGHRHIADIGLDGAEGIIGRLRRRRLGEGVEQGGLADIGQARQCRI